jgi:hypothetical protein
MSCYISSNNNRLYVALEQVYGEIQAITEANRIPAVRLGAKQVPDRPDRRDKTGSRTFAGLPNRVRKHTSFQLNTFMTQWDGTGQPSHSPLFQAAMGGVPLSWAGGTVASVSGLTQVTFTAAHGLTVGQGIVLGGEIRFVTAIPNPTTIVFNAGFSVPAVNGSVMTGTVTYKLEHFRLLGSEYGGAADLAGVGDEHHEAESERRLSRVRVRGAGQRHC